MISTASTNISGTCTSEVVVRMSMAHIADATPSIEKNISQPLRLVFMYSLHRDLTFEKNVPAFFIASFSILFLCLHYSMFAR